MKFIIKYTGYSEHRTLIYRDSEFSFDMEPWTLELDFEIAVNTVTLTVVDGKVIQLNGFCGLNSSMKANVAIPKSQKGELTILHSEKHCEQAGCVRINKYDWPVSVNIQTGWVCIGDPENTSNAVEFIDNCVAVIDDNNDFISLWLKPIILPNI